MSDNLDNKRIAWSCKIGCIEGVEVPNGGDLPMRMAVEAAFKAVTGQDAQAIFSGWGDEFTQTEKDIILNRV